MSGRNLLLAQALLMCLALSGSALAQEDAAARLCTSVLSIDVKDTNTVFSDEEHFAEFQDKLRTANFRSYDEFQKSGGNLGIDIPIAEGIIGLSGAAHNDSGTFQKEMSDFLSSTFSQKQDIIKRYSSSSTINSQLLSVLQNCHDKYFGTLRDRIALSVEVEPNSYGSFVVSFVANIPPPLGVPFMIYQIEPSGSVQCTQGGQPLSLPATAQGDQALLSCSKDEGKQISLRLRTNVGISPPIRLPAKPVPGVSTPVPAVTLIQADWNIDHPAVGAPLQFPCQCISYIRDSARKEDKLINNCKGTVTALAIKDSDADGQRTPALLQRHGRLFSYVVLNTGQTASFDFSDAITHVLYLYSCPGAPTPAAPLRCHIDPTVLPPNTPYSSCDPPNGGKIGDSCACPKSPSGTYPGKIETQPF